jgi:TolB-like protein/DNA-binding winged helix-turn-helix (wHTH) protein/tetratricopeptide (TPR) repeat protein
MSIPRINLAETSDFDLGALRVSPARRQVSMGGHCRELEPKVAQVLVALASASPAVVSRDRLVEQCWDGRIVGDDALNRCILSLRHLAKEYSPEPFAIETVPRVGYSLLAGPGGHLNGSEPRMLSRRRVGLLAVFALLLSAGLLLGWRQYQLREAAPTSIAVLPFRNLSSGDRFFAEGLSDEIQDQLTREPALRVAGSASSAQMAKETDPRKVGRSLGVDYLLEGSVRPDSGRVRVSAALVRTKDGTRLWSETYDRKLDDMLDIESAIGLAVANGLKRRLIYTVAAARAPISGPAYALYLQARGLLRSDNPQSGQEALRLLQQVIKTDPNFAPAWSGVAQAIDLDARTKDTEGLIDAIPQARYAAVRALQLDGRLPEAHETLAELAGGDTPEAIEHLRRAAALSPRSADGLRALGAAQHVSGQFTQSLATHRRSHDADPMWSAPTRVVLDTMSELGDRAGAAAWVNQAFPQDPLLRSFALARAAYHAGDFSEAARRWSDLAKGQTEWASPSRLSLQNVLLMLRLSNEQPSRPPRPGIGQDSFTPARIWMAAAPPASEWQRRNRSSAAELVYRNENIIAAKLMLNEGRARELVATYDSPAGLLGVRRGLTVGTCFLHNAAIAALALRAVGRRAEANVILAQADTAIRAAYRAGIVPLWFEEDAAGIWAVQGNSGEAIAALDRAVNRGSMHATRTDLLRLQDEPAFRQLRGNPHFDSVLAKYDAHFAKERAETASALHIRT